MSEEIKIVEKKKLNTNGKMKITGYAILGMALVLTLLIFFGAAAAEAVNVSLVQFWAGVGLALLFGNAGKNIVGGYYQEKASSLK